jgi:hypothetical protein
MSLTHLPKIKAAKIKSSHVLDGYSPIIKLSKLSLSNAKLIMFPKCNGMIIDCNGNLVRESIKHGKIDDSNPYILIDNEDRYFLKPNLKYQNLESCTICFDCATNNYYHLLIIYYSFLVVANQYTANQKFVVPTSHKHQEAYVSPIISEILNKFTLQNGNQFLNLSNGIYRVEQLNLIFVDDEINGYEAARRFLIFSDVIKQGFADLKLKLLGSKVNFGKRIYVSRQKSTRRIILNEPEIKTTLDKYGFETVFLEDMTLQQQVETFASAQIVIGVHGAGLSNMVFAEKEATLFELLVEKQDRPFFLNICASLGINYTALECKRKKNNIIVNQKHFEKIIQSLVSSS